METKIEKLKSLLDAHEEACIEYGRAVEGCFSVWSADAAERASRAAIFKLFEENCKPEKPAYRQIAPMFAWKKKYGAGKRGRKSAGGK